jgi:hypothetical protein
MAGASSHNQFSNDSGTLLWGEETDAADRALAPAVLAWAVDFDRWRLFMG